MKVTSAQVTAIIEHLEQIRRRPDMYLGETSERAFTGYLAGFGDAFRLLGQEYPSTFYWQVAEERGWGPNALGPQKHMRDAGWTEEAIVEELLVIEIEAWQRFLGDQRIDRRCDIQDACQ